MTTTTETEQEVLLNAAYDVGYAMLDTLGSGDDDDDTHNAHRRSAAAVLIAALAQDRWTGDAARYVVAHAVDGFDKEEWAVIEQDAEKIAGGSAWSGFPPEQKHQIKVFRTLLREQRPSLTDNLRSGGVALDLDGPPAAARWLVPDFLVRGKVHMLSGPTHVFKTGLREAMMSASVLGRPFLGREVPALRWMVLDGENSREDIEARWRALGIRNEHIGSSIHLTPREGPGVEGVGHSGPVRLGEAGWDDWLRDEIASFRPDVLVIDSVARCCAGVNGRDEDAVARFFSEVLVPLVTEHDLALLYTAHHRKSGGRAGTDEAVLGSAQWSGQAEQTITVATTGALKLTPRTDGGHDTARPFVLRRPKGRTLVGNTPEHFTVTGQLDADAALVAMHVGSPNSEPTTVQRLLAALESPLGTTALAEAVKLNRTGTKFRAALDEAVDAGLIVKTHDGLYERAET